jgi:hypothetical protein
MAHSLAWWRAVARRFSLRRRVAQARLEDTQEYPARHLIHRTLADHAELRRRAPASMPAAARYQSLLQLELRALEELERALRDHMDGAETEDALAEAHAELEQLRTEVAWCRLLLAGRRPSHPSATPVEL